MNKIHYEERVKTYTTYLTFPDGLRLIVNNGRYVGWYVTEEG